MTETLLIVKSLTEYETIKRINKTAFASSVTPAGANMEINAFIKNKNIYQNQTIRELERHRFKNESRLRIIERQRLRTVCQLEYRNRGTSGTTIIQISNSCCGSNRLKSQMIFSLTKQNLWLMLCLVVTLIYHVESYEATTTKGTSSSVKRFSQLLFTDGQMTINDNNSSVNNDNTFRPFIPEDREIISNNVFTPSGKFRVFESIGTDLRTTMLLQKKNQYNGKNELLQSFNTSVKKTNVATDFQTPATPISSFQYGRPEHKARSHKNFKPNVLHFDNESNSNNLLTKQQKEQQEKQQQLSKIRNSTENSYEPNSRRNDTDVQKNEITKQDNDGGNLKSDSKNLEDLLVDYIINFFEKGQYEPIPGLTVELKNNHSESPPNNVVTTKDHVVRKTRAATDANIRIDLSRTLPSGRLLFLTGLKKILWPVFMGLQVLKSLLIVMFIPAIIGSFTKLLGKGISTGSAPLFIRPMDPPQELDFRDSNINFDDDNFIAGNEGFKDNGNYAYNRPDASQIQNEYIFDPASTNNQLSFTRFGMNERQHQLMQDSYMSALQSIGSASFKNSGTLSSSSSVLGAPMTKKPPSAANINTFQQFQKVPDSTLLLSNYDPFYSPLLSRLDSVFAQLKINSDKETCREKVVCLMYANPAKYAPYSNLVSAQLSRELNELRKPISDNPDILRFFKYMRAAKDGQDGIDCEEAFDKCIEFKDFANPAMVSTYHDINKLVQARKLTKK